MRRLSTVERLRAVADADVYGALPPNILICMHCNGYGSAMADPPGVDTCTICGGSGLMKNS